MYDDDYVSSIPYRLMPPRKRAGSDISEALDAVRASGSAREALDAASGTAPESGDPGDALSWQGATPSRQRQWPRRLVRALVRTDVWILIVGIAGVVIAYLAWVKPH